MGEGNLKKDWEDLVEICAVGTPRAVLCRKGMKFKGI